MTFKNIFDTENTSDIDADYRKSLMAQGIRQDTRKLLDLFDKKPMLSVEEIGVAFYRLYNEKKSRSWILSTLNRLVKMRLLSIDCENGQYCKPSSAENIEF